MNDFYKIGQVIEVQGQKLRIRVFENNNSNILMHQGNVIKNVSGGRTMVVLTMTFIDEPMAKNMSFQRKYAEPL